MSGLLDNYYNADHDHHFGIELEDLRAKYDDEQAKFRAFRRSWIPSIKLILASATDIFGDWIFFSRTKATSGLDEFEKPLLIFCIISSVLGGCTLMSIFLDKVYKYVQLQNKNQDELIKRRRSVCMTWVKWLLGLEMFIEDIPQLVLTVMILKAKNGGEWSPVAVFNATTSGFNFVFNLLDMFMPLDEEDISNDVDNNNKKNNGGKPDDSSNKIIRVGNGNRQSKQLQEGMIQAGNKGKSSSIYLNEKLSYEQQMYQFQSTSSSSLGTIGSSTSSTSTACWEYDSKNNIYRSTREQKR